jgi:hypothetical protein
MIDFVPDTRFQRQHLGHPVQIPYLNGLIWRNWVWRLAFLVVVICCPTVPLF